MADAPDNSKVWSPQRCLHLLVGPGTHARHPLFSLHSSAAVGGSGQRGEEAEVPSCAAPPHLGALQLSGCSTSWAASLECSRTSHQPLGARHTCCLVVDHGMYPWEVHSFFGPQSPSQGPPNPVRHLFPRWAARAFGKVLQVLLGHQVLPVRGWGWRWREDVDRLVSWQLPSSFFTPFE